MWVLLILLYSSSFFGEYSCSNCIDYRSNIVSQGRHYVPGSNPCILCICDQGNPKWCKSILCAPPPECKSFQLGDNCCDFLCLDDLLVPPKNSTDTDDVTLRFAASACTLGVSLLGGVYYLYHRLKEKKKRLHQSSPLSEEQSLNSIGYITGSFGYLPDNTNYLTAGNGELEFQYGDSSARYSLWKPRGTYFIQGEAPPPYDEAMRSSSFIDNIETLRPISTSTTSVGSQTVLRQMHTVVNHIPSQSRHEEEVHRQRENNYNPQYANIESIQNSSTTTSKSDPQIVTHNREKICTCKEYVNIQQIQTGSKQIETCSCKESKSNLKNELKKIINSNSFHNININKPSTSKDNSNNIYENIIKSKYNVYEEDAISDEERQNAASSTLLKDNRNHLKIKPSRELQNLLLGDRLSNSVSKFNDKKVLPLHRTLSKNLRELIVKELPAQMPRSDSGGRIQMLHANYSGVLDPSDTRNIIETVRLALEASHKNSSKTMGRKPAKIPDIHEDVELKANNKNNEMEGRKMKKDNRKFKYNAQVGLERVQVEPVRDCDDGTLKQVAEDKKQRSKSCDGENMLSVKCLSSSLDDEDYRSECENCKSGYISKNEEDDVLNETMTLQRRPLEPDEDSFYRTSVTLPLQMRKPRTKPKDKNRETWFKKMQDTSSSEESD